MDSDLKTLNVFKVSNAYEKINDMIEQSIGSYLETMPKTQLSELAKYVKTFDDVPLDNLAKEDNFDYASELIRKQVYSFIVDKINSQTNSKPTKQNQECNLKQTKNTSVITTDVFFILK